MSSPETTSLLQSWAEGDQAAFHRLMEHVVDDLRQLARRELARERARHTLQPTALVNEVFLRLVGTTKLRYQNRVHFFATCARIMRRILVDYARQRGALKRGGGQTMISLEHVREDELPAAASGLDIIVLDEALSQLKRLDSRQATIVELRYFAGCTLEEIARHLGFTGRTIKTEWKKAKVWLAHRLA